MTEKEMALKEKFEELKKEFFKAAKNAVANAIKNKVINEDKINPPKVMEISVKRYPTSQYAGIIYYYKVTFKKTVTLENGSENDRVIKGFHIMPYRINAEDMEKAEKQSKEKDFNKRVTVTDKSHKDYNSQLVDYDEGSGNFHKVPDGEFQVVLLDATAKPDGPGKKPYKNRFDNKDMYFPHPDSKNVHKGNDLEQFIKDAMDYLKKNEKKE